MIKIPDPENEGQEIEVYTAEEKAEVEAQRDAALAEAEKYKAVSAEKTENFKKLNEMTEAEKTAMGAEKVENLKRIEAAEAKAAALEAKINGDTEARVTSTKESALAKFHGGNETLKKALEENYALINLEGTDEATIQQRAQLALNMELGKNNANKNPLMSVMGGSAPVMRTDGKGDKFLESERGKQAIAQMGD